MGDAGLIEQCALSCGAWNVHSCRSQFQLPGSCSGAGNDLSPNRVVVITTACQLEQRVDIWRLDLATSRRRLMP